MSEDSIRADIENIRRDIARLEQNVSTWTTSNCFQRKEFCVSKERTCDRRFDALVDDIAKESIAREKAIKPILYLLLTMLAAVLLQGLSAYFSGRVPSV